MKKSYAEFRDVLPVLTRICNKLQPEEMCFVLKLATEVYETENGNVFNPPLTLDRTEIRTQCRLILDGLANDTDVLRFLHKTCCTRESVNYVTAYASVREFLDVLKRYAPLLHRGVTEWYPGTTKPVRVGWYETNGWMTPCRRRYWDGHDWVGSFGVVDEWRGITQMSHAVGECA